MQDRNWNSIDEFLNHYQLTDEDYFIEDTSGNRIIRKSGIAKIQIKAGFTFKPPQVLWVCKDDKICYGAAVSVTDASGKYNEIGSADLRNCSNMQFGGKYPTEMAKNRAEAKLTLRMANATQFRCYSDCESDAWVGHNPHPTTSVQTTTQAAPPAHKPELTPEEVAIQNHPAPSASTMPITEASEPLPSQASQPTQAVSIDAKVKMENSFDLIRGIGEKINADPNKLNSDIAKCTNLDIAEHCLFHYQALEVAHDRKWDMGAMEAKIQGMSKANLKTFLSRFTPTHGVA